MTKIAPLGALALCLSLAALPACLGQADSTPTEAAEGAVTAGSTAVGPIPAGLPARELVGLFEGPGATWMKSSGVPWDVRYQYFTKGWVNNWGWGNADGSWGLSYMQECDSQHFIPAVEYYQINGEAGGGESAFLSKMQNAATMKSYFGDFKILMQRVKDFGKPVLILMEADGFGFLEQQTSGNSNAYAAVKDSGLPELAGLPNTVAGWGLAFLQLRKSVGAGNAILGIHLSAWASGEDVAYGSVSDSLQPQVDKVYAFLSPFGLTANATGGTWDLLVGDPLDRDSDYYKLVQGQNRWWDASDSASINSMSFNRYAEWVRLWNVKAQRRWILWQIPLGNSNHRDVANDGTARAGYKDNRPEYFFLNGTAHLAKFANDGVIGLLFGAGASGQSSYQNDQYTDGQLFMQSRAGAILKAGGVSLSSGSSTGTGGSTGAGGTTATGGTIGTGGTTGTGGSAPSDTAQYNFESGAQSWTVTGAPMTGVASSTAQAFAGTHALAVTINGAAGDASAVIASPSTPAGKTVTFHVWIPAGSAISAIQPFVLQGSAGGWTWTGNWQAIGSLKTGGWNTLSVAVPTNAATPLFQLGVDVTTNATWSGTLYVDSVSW